MAADRAGVGTTVTEQDAKHMQAALLDLSDQVATMREIIVAQSQAIQHLTRRCDYIQTVMPKQRATPTRMRRDA